MTATKQTYHVSGMTCEACEYKIRYVLGQIEGIRNVETNLSKNQVSFESERTVALSELELILKPHAKYSIAQKQEEVKNDTKTEENNYYPLFLIFAYLIVVTLLISAVKIPKMQGVGGLLHNFMTGFFLVFSFFKLLNVKAFADSFAMYDLLAARWPHYGKIYPFLELALGLLCLVHYEAHSVYVADIMLMGFGNLGVIRSVLNKKQIQCACLGTVFDLPMSTVTIIENTVMVAIGVILLVIT